MTPQLFPIDQLTDAGRAIVARMGAVHGAALAAAAAVPVRLFGLASPLAPGLSFSGAEAVISSIGSRETAMIASGGTGSSLPDALASCLGETIERLSQAERQGDVHVRAPVSAACSDLDADVAQSVRDITVDNQLAPDTPIDWIAAKDLAQSRDILLPADWCLRRATEGPMRMRATPLSVGVAAGRTFDDAVLGAVLELIERDAVALWWVGGRRGRPIGPERLAASGAPEVIAIARQDMRGRTTWIIDITTDLSVPAVAAMSVSEDGKGFACGTAARLTLRDAVRSAVFELCQMELGLLVADLKRRHRGDEALTEVDRQHHARATKIDAANCDLIHPVGSAQPIPDIVSDNGLDALRQILSNAAIDVALAHLTRPDYAIEVIAAVAPALQRFPSAVHTARLKRVIAEAGGGARWTHGVGLG